MFIKWVMEKAYVILRPVVPADIKLGSTTAIIQIPTRINELINMSLTLNHAGSAAPLRNIVIKF